MTDETDEAGALIAGHLERIANRLDEPMTKPWKELLGELREINQNLKTISLEIYRVGDELNKHRQ